MIPPGWLKFLAACTVVAILFGVAHDLVTAHVSTPYFTVHHPKVVDSDSAVVMALVWGFLATFWVGLGAGILLAMANLMGRWPRLGWREILHRFMRLTVGLWASSMIVLIASYALISLIPQDKRGPGFESDHRLMSVAITHQWSYFAAALTTLGLAIWVILRRKASQA